MTKHFKRPLSILLAVMMVVGLFSAIPMTVSAATSSDGLWNWFYNYGLGGISGYLGGANSGTLTVPHIIDDNTDKPLTLIDSMAFADCPQLNEVILEEGYTSLEYGAFQGANINKVVLPSTISEYDYYGGLPFAGSNVKEVEITSGVTTLADYMFADSSSLTKVTLPSTITNIGADPFAGLTLSNITVVVEENSDVHNALKTKYPSMVFEYATSHVHAWQVSSMTLDADDRETVNVELECPDDDATTSVTLPAGEYTVVETVTEATCVADGEMTINATFIKDGQEIIVTGGSVTLPQYDKHDYSVQKWTWWGDTPSSLVVSCAHCSDSDYENPDSSYRKMLFEGTVAPNNNLRTVDDNGVTRAYINTNAQFFSYFISNYALRGTVYSDNNYAYYTDTAPTWDWADDYSYATATFDDETVITDDDIYSEQIIDTLDGDKEKTRYVATVNYRGNEYNSAQKVDTPVTHTITWLNDDGTTIDTTTVLDGVVPTHTDPTKAEDANYTYTFNGWTPDVVAATADAEYTAQFTAVPKHVHDYTTTWFWTENQSSYSATLRLVCEDGDSTVTLSGDDITYDYNPYCTSYNGLETTYTASAVYEGETYTNTKTVSSVDPLNVISSIPLDNIMITASEAKAQDDNPFNLGDDVYYRNAGILGVQKKEAIATTDGLGTGTDLRFVAVANSELLENAQDYGFIVATSAQSVWNTDKQIGALTAESFADSIYSCRGTDNTISGDYGKLSTNTDYKYVTVAVNGVDEDITVAARFYIQDSNGVYHYAKYTNQYYKTYQGIAVKYSDLG